MTASEGMQQDGGFSLPAEMAEAAGGEVWAVVIIAVGPGGAASRSYNTGASDDVWSAVQVATAAAGSAFTASIESALDDD